MLLLVILAGGFHPSLPTGPLSQRQTTTENIQSTSPNATAIAMRFKDAASVADGVLATSSPGQYKLKFDKAGIKEMKRIVQTVAVSVKTVNVGNSAGKICGSWRSGTATPHSIAADRAMLFVWWSHALNSVVRMVRTFNKEIMKTVNATVNSNTTESLVDKMRVIVESLGGLAQATRECAALLAQLVDCVENFLHDQEVGMDMYTGIIFDTLMYADVCCHTIILLQPSDHTYPSFVSYFCLVFRQ